MKPSACLLLGALLLAGCHDPAFDPPTYTEKEIRQAQTDGYVEGLYTLCAILIDPDFMRYLADTGANLSNYAFQRFELERTGPYIGKAVGAVCRRATQRTRPTGPT